MTAMDRLLKIVGDPTNGGTTAPPPCVVIAWTDWQEFVKEASPPADAQAAGPQPLKKGVKT